MSFFKSEDKAAEKNGDEKEKKSRKRKEPFKLEYENDEEVLEKCMKVIVV